MRPFLFFFLSIFLLNCFSSCKNESNQADFDKNLLVGRWELDKAWRNGKQTETLTGAYYEFGNDGKMLTNLTPNLMDDNFSYEFSGSEIKQQSDPEVILSVENLNDSLLVMSMTINKFPFRLQLKKAMPPVESMPGPADTL